MSQARRMRHVQQRQNASHVSNLGVILGDFYEFLSQTPQPSDDKVREFFISCDNKWKQYCKIHKLMNVDHLFKLNVREAWKRHTVPATQGEESLMK